MDVITFWFEVLRSLSINVAPKYQNGKNDGITNEIGSHCKAPGVSVPTICSLKLNRSRRITLENIISSFFLNGTLFVLNVDTDS